MRRIALLLILLGATAHSAFAAGRLEIANAWIRSAPPGAMMLAGYATLHNTGDAPVIVTAAGSADFGDVSLHKSVEENGVMRMLPLQSVVIAPGASIDFAPGERHLMLMQPRRELKRGDSVKISLTLQSGAAASAEFLVRDEAPAPNH
jgi:periplasmic copper chaperone A